VKQFMQVVAMPSSPSAPPAPVRLLVDPCFAPPGEGRLECSKEEKPSLEPDVSGGEVGIDCGMPPNIFPSRETRIEAELGVEDGSGIFCRL
jgi:hypothetical protein